MGEHLDAALVKAALCMAAAVRGGTVTGVIFHSYKGGEHTADTFAKTCDTSGILQSMGTVGSALDKAAAKSFNSTLEWELLSRRRSVTKARARSEVAAFIDRFNHQRRHSSCEMNPPSSTNRSAPNVPPNKPGQHENRDPTAASRCSQETR